MEEYAFLREKLPSLRVNSEAINELFELLEDLSKETIAREVANWRAEYQKDDPDEIISYYERAKERYGVKITLIYNRNKINSYSSSNSFAQLQNFCKNNKILGKEVEAIELSCYLIEKNVDVRFHKEEFGSEVYIRADNPRWAKELCDRIKNILKRYKTINHLFHTVTFTIGLPFVLLTTGGVISYLLTKNLILFFSILIFYPFLSFGLRKFVLVYLPYTSFLLEFIKREEEKSKKEKKEHIGPRK